MRFILIILDGCSYNILKEVNTPFFDTIIKKGVYSLECNAVIPTATYTGHASIMTGCYPEKTGMVGNQFYDRIDQLIKHFDFYDPNVHIQAKTIFEYFEEYKPLSINEPISKGAIEKITPKEINKYPIIERDEYIYKITMKFLEKNKNDLIVINFSGIDSIGEIYGPFSENYKEEISKVDKYIENIYNLSSSNKETILIITADHGLTEIKCKYDIQKDLEIAGLKVYSLPSHRACHIYLQNEDYNKVLNFLESNEYIKYIYDKEKMKELRLEHERSGDFIVFAADGVEFEVDNLKGSHGGLNKEELKVPLLILCSDNFYFNLENCCIVDILPTLLNFAQLPIDTYIDGNILIEFSL